MSTRVVDRVEDWGGRSFSGGYPALHDLADREFSGVVRAGGAELYMTKGVVVGVRQGSIEDLADAEGTAFEAPSPALPLLAVMQERDGEVRDEFYSEKTSIAEVDRTLSEGGFTGYIELSENVLSGDYYQVYQAGRSMSVGFVGESARLIDGDEAFETADDEVGIYKVHAVDVEPTEIPERGRASGAATGTDGADRTGAAGTDATTGTDTTAGADTTAGEDTATGAGSRGKSGTGREDEASEPSARDHDGRDSAGRSGSRQPTEESPAEGTGADGSSDTERAGGSQPDDSPAQPEAASEPDEPADWDQEAARGRAGQGSGPAGAEEALDLEQRAIPSLDPDQTARSNGSTADSAPDSQEQPRSRDPGEAASRQPEGDRSGPERHPTQPQEQPADQEPGTEATPQQPREQGREATQQSSESTREPTRESPDTTARQSSEPTREATDTTSRETGQPRETTQRPGESPSAPAVDPERVETLEAELEKREVEISRLEGDLASATAERNDLREELAAVREERDELAAEVERLEDELARLEEELGAATEAERRITGEEALAGTDVFVRYHSKGDATLEKAHGSSTRKEEVNDNLRLEKHTQFETGAVAVGSQSYSEYIEGTVEYQFVEWLVRQLLFEIRETGHEKELRTLYDVLPAVDRAELAGVVDVVYSADGQETRSEEAFDIILRDRMGNPLLVANLNDSREAATEPMMEDLITAAERVGQTAQQFAGAFLVTRSFFDPGALEVAEGATRGGLLSRDKRKSFVNISRKRGYHLCLVEARNENFHLAVPEL